MVNISFKIDTAPYHAWVAERDRRMRRAAMWTVREGGRVVRREARSRAPVDTGALKKSIAPSRRLTYEQTEEAWSLKVGPRGWRVHLYAAIEEEREGYMEAGYEAAESMMAAVAERAYTKAWKGI